MFLGIYQKVTPDDASIILFSLSPFCYHSLFSHSKMKLLTTIWLLGPCLLACQCAPAADKVTDLPGLTFVPDFNHYSGFLRAFTDKYFHYWFTESSRKPSEDPLVLWLNGGPGCSSLEGLIEELGPFHVKDYGNSVYYNPYAWNKVIVITDNLSEPIQFPVRQRSVPGIPSWRRLLLHNINQPNSHRRRSIPPELLGPR